MVGSLLLLIALTYTAFMMFQMWRMTRAFEDALNEPYDDEDLPTEPVESPISRMKGAVKKHRNPPVLVPLDDQDAAVIAEVAARVFGPQGTPPDRPPTD